MCTKIDHFIPENMSILSCLIFSWKLTVAIQHKKSLVCQLKEALHELSSIIFMATYGQLVFFINAIFFFQMYGNSQKMIDS